jgi:hypothetical protein
MHAHEGLYTMYVHMLYMQRIVYVSLYMYVPVIYRSLHNMCLNGYKYPLVCRMCTVYVFCGNSGCSIRTVVVPDRRPTIDSILERHLRMYLAVHAEGHDTYLRMYLCRVTYIYEGI